MNFRSMKQRGYLIAVLSVAVAMVTLAYLALVAHSSKVQDLVEIRGAQTAALYAAESGLLRAEHELSARPEQAPGIGYWLKGEFPNAGSKYRIEVLSEGHSAKEFSIRSVGQAEGESGRLHTVEFEAQYLYQAGKGWTAQWRAKV